MTTLRPTLAALAALFLLGPAAAQPDAATATGAPVQLSTPAPEAAPPSSGSNTLPLATPAAAAGPAAVLIRGGTVHTLTTQGIISGGDVLIVGGKIAAVGQGIAPPPGAQIIAAQGKPVTPGLMASFTQLGISEIDLVRETDDTTTDGTIASAAFDVTDALNPNSSLIPVARIRGVTRAVVAPNPGPGVFAGQAAVIQLGAGPDIVVRPHVGMFVTLGPIGANTDRARRPVVWASFRETMADAREYLARRVQYRQPGGSRDQRSAHIDLDALAPVLAGQEPLVVFADRASDIREAIAYAKEQKLRLIIAGGAEAWLVAKELAAAQVPVLVDVQQNLPEAFSTLAATLANAARLDAAGVKVAFQPPGDEPSHNARLVSQIAGNAVANGMNYEHALAAITRYPAEIWGIADTYGTLEVGKDADVVVWDGDPLEVTSAPTAVFIRGQKMPMESRQTQLRDRYRDLSRKNPPFGYR